MDITIIIAKLKEEMKELFTLKTDTPTKVSDLINDLNFIMRSEVRNDVASTDTNLPLSANQGRLLNNKVDTKSDSNHTHENISDSGWQNVVFESGFQNYDANHPVRYRRIGKIVHLEGIIKNSSAFTPGTSEQKVAFINDVYCRPSYPQYALMQGTDGNKFLLAINTNGNISIARYGTTAATTQVGAGAWLHCYASWIIDTELISIPTSIVEYNSNATLDDTFRYTIQLKNNNNNNGISNKSIKYYLDGTSQSTQTTGSNGTIEFNIPYSTWSNKGNHTLRFDFAEDDTYRASTMSNTISYNSVTRPTGIDINSSDALTYYYPNGITITDTWPLCIQLKNTNNNQGINGKSVKYYLDNSLKSTQTTIENGFAKFSIPISTISGTASHTIRFDFAESLPYRACSNSYTFTGQPSQDPIISN